jgi:UDP-glucose 4-epimerase
MLKCDNNFLFHTNANHLSQLGTTLVTGGAGFIGSHLVDLLVSNLVDVIVLDNLSTGSLANLSACIDRKNFNFIGKALGDSESLKKCLEGTRTVFHCAANPEPRDGIDNAQKLFEENTKITLQLLEQIRNSSVENILFTSSSTVYGEPEIFPTPEEYGPLLPISAYGASKLACEGLISSYCNTYGIKSRICRLANIVGSRSRHGVVWDFVNKLRQDSGKLEVLGDGTQSKSYLHVSDCVESFFFCLEFGGKVETFNVGNYDAIDVITIAKSVCDVMNLRKAKIVPRGGIDGRGWVGDVKKMQLEISKLKRLGWSPMLSSAESVKRACQELISEHMVRTVGA